MSFSNKQLRMLLIPLMIEQFLTSLIGSVDTIMVSNLGDAAVSGVALVDSITKLVIFLFTALATGGTIVCSQYIGRRDRLNANRAAGQLLLGAFALSVAIAAVCALFRDGILRLIFGSVERSVFDAASAYFQIVIISYPFVALFGAGAALYRASGNSRLPMKISLIANLINIVGNALLMFVFHMGVRGAATATLASNVFAAVTMLTFLRRPGQSIDIGAYRKLRPDMTILVLVLSIGIPSGIENAMFQFGKLAVQSTVSTLGTTAMAASAIVCTLELFTSMPSQAIATGLMTVAGQCIGAGKSDEAAHYIKKLTRWSFFVMVTLNWLIMALTPLVIKLAGMDAESAEICMETMWFISIMKPLLWAWAFVPVSGMRAAGDVKYGMIVSICTMWILRVGLSTALCRFFDFGLIGIWLGYAADWGLRSALFMWRFRSGKWKEKRVIHS